MTYSQKQVNLITFGIILLGSGLDAKLHMFLCEKSLLSLFDCVKIFFSLAFRIIVIQVMSVRYADLQPFGLKNRKNAMVLDRPTETGRRFDFPPESLKIPADKVKSTTQ